MKRVMIQLTEEQHEATRRLAFEEHRSIADVVREALAEYLARKDKREARREEER